MVVYLIHFNKPIGNPQNPHGQARHYLGCCEDLDKRLDLHRQGRSRVPIVKAFKRAGVDFVLARTWQVPDGESGRGLERQLKNCKNNRTRLCPICREAH